MKPISGGDVGDAGRREDYSRQIARLPLTMRPTLYQQSNEWDDLFPFEQKRLARFVDSVSRIQPSELNALTHALRELEIKMDVSNWNFSISAETMSNASQLARSPYFAQWRREVQKVFSAIEGSGRDAAQRDPQPRRLLLLVFPESLPVASIAPGKPWDSRAIEYRIQGDARQVCEFALQGPLNLPSTISNASDETRSDCWLLDADATLGGMLAKGSPPPVSLLEYGTLREFRDEFLARVNTVPKDITATDEILDRVRRRNWDPWWPKTLAAQNRLRSFVIRLFLSGNGALIFSNAFVQWAASEALRRARPRLVVCRFGLRSKPKPFTSIAIFENQQRISALRVEDDPEGSALDALMLARYVWLSALRFPENEEMCCVAIAESSSSLYVIAPDARRPVWPKERRALPEDVCEWMHSTLKS